MNSARAWLNRARGLRQVKAPLKKMREVLHSGQRLGTSLAEVDQLRADIRRREWEENAKRVNTFAALHRYSHQPCMSERNHLQLLP